MTRQISISALTGVMLLGLIAAPFATAQDASAPLAVASARVSLAGTSNIHEFTAATTEVRVTRVALANGVSGAALLATVLNPGAVEAFEIAIRTTSLASPTEGIDKNMHKALKAAEFKDITFRLVRLEATTAPAPRAAGMLKIAGVEREVAFDLKTTTTPAAVTVTGTVPLVMTDYGITPPKAMLGMLKTDPRITVTFELVLAVPATFTR